MIEITVYLANNFDSKYEEIEITKDELLQLACNKAKEMYQKDFWNIIRANDEITVKVNVK